MAAVGLTCGLHELPIVAESASGLYRSWASLLGEEPPSVWNPVLLVDVEEFPEAGWVEMVQLLAWLMSWLVL